MEIYGFNKTTLLDYPGHVAATIFTGGCNFRCPFCHNAPLVLRPESLSCIPQAEVFSCLEKRSSVLEGVCITGGEPTLQRDLEEFIVRVRRLGYLVKLDTNGSRPDVLRRLLERQLLDYVAMDVKAAPDNYARACGCADAVLPQIRESIAILKECTIPCEFRTTVVKGIHTEEEFEKIGKLLEGSRAYYLQAYRDDENVLFGNFDTFSVQEMQAMADRAKKYIDKVELRGVE